MPMTLACAQACAEARSCLAAITDSADEFDESICFDRLLLDLDSLRGGAFPGFYPLTGKRDQLVSRLEVAINEMITLGGDGFSLEPLLVRAAGIDQTVARMDPSCRTSSVRCRCVVSLLRVVLAGPSRRGVVALLHVASGLVGPRDDVTDVPDLGPSQGDDGLRELGTSWGAALPDIDGVGLHAQDPSNLLRTSEVSGVLHRATLGPDRVVDLSARRPPLPTENSYSGGIVTRVERANRR